MGGGTSGSQPCWGWGWGWDPVVERAAEIAQPLELCPSGSLAGCLASDLFIFPTSPASCFETSPAGHTAQASPYHPRAWSVRSQSPGRGTTLGRLGKGGWAFYFFPHGEAVWLPGTLRSPEGKQLSTRAILSHPLVTTCTIIYLIVGLKPAHF